MNAADFRAHVQEALETLPKSVKDETLPLPDRQLQALIHLNTNIYPALKNNTWMHLEILRMKDGPEKLQCGILWSLAVSQNSPEDMRAIIKSMDEYVAGAVS